MIRFASVAILINSGGRSNWQVFAPGTSSVTILATILTYQLILRPSKPSRER